MTTPPTQAKIERIDFVDIGVGVPERWLLRGFTLMGLKLGTIHGIVGDNGSGKTSFLRLLSGYFKDTWEVSGQILINGRDVGRIFNRQVARAHGIFLVPQEPSIVQSLSVWENITLGGATSHLGGLVQRRSHDRARCAGFLESMEWKLSIDSAGGELGLPERQLVLIARALLRRPAPQLVLFDEPTTHISDRERHHLLRNLRLLKRRGVGVILVSHDPSDIVEVCDSVSVVAQGRVVSTYRRDSMAPREFRQRIFAGRPKSPPLKPLTIETPPDSCLILSHREQRTSIPLAKSRTVGLWFRNDRIADRAFNSLLFGASNEIQVRLWSQDHGWVSSTPVALRAAGIATIPSRKRERGIIEAFTVHENLSIGSTHHLRLWSAGARRYSSLLSDSVGLPRTRIYDTAGHLSGGLQQRVVIARAMAGPPAILLLRNPGQGLDGDSNRKLQELLSNLSGSAVIFTGRYSELEHFANSIVDIREVLK